MQAGFSNYPLQGFLHLSLMHLVLVQAECWLESAGLVWAGKIFVLWDVYVHLDIPMLCCFHLIVFWHRSSHLNSLACSSVIIWVPACHHLNMRNSNCRPKSNSLVKWFVLDVLWDRDYQMSVWVCWRSCVFACPPFEGWGRLSCHPY